MHLLVVWYLVNLQDGRCNNKEHQEYFLWGKGGRCLGLTTLPPPCASRLEIWEPQPPGHLMAYPSLYRDCCTFPSTRMLPLPSPTFTPVSSNAVPQSTTLTHNIHFTCDNCSITLPHATYVQFFNNTIPPMQFDFKLILWPLNLIYQLMHLYNHHHISVMELGHLLNRSGLTYPEVSSKVCHNFFCQLDNSVSLPWVIYYESFYLHVVSSFSCTPVICPKLV